MDKKELKEVTYSSEYVDELPHLIRSSDVVSL